MRIYSLLIAVIFASTNLAIAAEVAPKTQPTTKESADKPISQEIKELSNKEIFGKYKKNIVPVKINEASEEDKIDDISIIYESPRKSGSILTPGSPKSTSSLGFKVKDHDPKDISSLIALGYKAALSGQTEAAITLYKQALGQESSNTNVLFALASLYHRLAQYKEAKIHYRKLLTISPDYKKALNNYLVLMSEESPSQALVELKELEKENPDFSPIQAQIGMIYAQIGDFHLAEQHLRRAIILSPEVLNYRYNLGVVYDNMKRYNEAIALYKQVIDGSGTGDILPQSSNAIRNRMTYLQEKIAVQRD